MKTLLVFFILFVTIPLFGQQIIKQDKIYYEIVNNEVHVCRVGAKKAYKGTGKLEIASKVVFKGLEYPVTRIQASAFECYSNVTSAIVPGTVKVIEKNAFGSCSSLKMVRLEEGVQEIQSGSLTGIGIVVLPKSLRIIEPNSYDSGAKIFKEEKKDVYTYLGTL